MSTDYEDIAGGGSFAKFDEVGDKVEGTVIACGIDTATDFDQNPVPGIDVDTADGIVTVTCSNASLKRKASTAIAMPSRVSIGASSSPASQRGRRISATSSSRSS